MQVLSVRCGLTKNLGNYESAKLEVEAAPSDGQTADELLSEVNDYLSKQLEAAGAPTNGNGKEKPAKKETPAPPLASGDGKKAKPANPTKGDSSESPQTPPATSSAAKSNATSTPTNGAEPAKKRGRPKKQPADVGALRDAALNSETLEELRTNFVQLRLAVPQDFDADKWESTVDRVEEVYRQLQQSDTSEVDTKVLSDLAAGFTAERLRITNRKAAVNDAA